MPRSLQLPEESGEESPQVYWERRLSAQFDLRGAGCRVFTRHYNAWLYRVRRRVFLQHARALGTDWTAARVADIGCGTGFYLNLWRRLGVRSLTGVDFSPTAIMRLRTVCPECAFIQAAISQPLKVDLGGTFDAISAMDVLFQIMDDGGYAQALRTLGVMLKPGGLALHRRLRPRRGPVRTGRHHIWRPLKEIMQCVQAAGLRVVTRRPVFVLMNSPVDLPHPWAEKFWGWLSRADSMGELMGFDAGALLFPVELALTRILPEGPSTELMVCRKG